MSDRIESMRWGIVHRMVCQEAGLSFQDDGLYFIDYGWEWKVADWAEIEGEFEDWEETDDE